MLSQLWPYPMIAHRGGGNCAPENTVAGMQAAYERGFKAVEFDVMLASDGVPIVMHDADLGRTVKGKGCVATISSSEIIKMDAGQWFDQTRGIGKVSYVGERVPLLMDIVRYCHQHDIWMNIEIKPVPGWEVETGRRIAQEVGQYWKMHTQMKRLPLLSSFSLEALEAALREAPELQRGVLYDALPDNWCGDWKALKCVGIHCNQEKISPVEIAAMKSVGAVVLCYTVNTIEKAKTLFSWGVDGIFTDALDVFKQGV